jgi:hypothetical protein
MIILISALIYSTYFFSILEHLLSLVPIADGLKHRPRAEWSVVYMTCEVHNAEIWLRSALPDDQCEEVNEYKSKFNTSHN